MCEKCWGGAFFGYLEGGCETERLIYRAIGYPYVKLYDLLSKSGYKYYHDHTLRFIF